MPGLHAAGSDVVLIVRTGTRRCALRASHVVEVMRPLPLEPFANSPGFVLGLAVIRGVPVPVVDLAGLLGGTAGMDALGILDSQLLMLLGTARMIPEAAWAELERAGE